MTRLMMAFIEKTCGVCRAKNRIFTTDVRPSWRINCSRCGSPIVERRGFRPHLVGRTVTQTGVAHESG